MWPSAYGGTNTPKSAPSPFSKTAVSNVPSTSIAALPWLNVWIVLLAVSTSEFVQPLERNASHFSIWATSFGEVQGILPEERSFHCAGEYPAPITTYA